MSVIVIYWKRVSDIFLAFILFFERKSKFCYWENTDEASLKNIKFESIMIVYLLGLYQKHLA